MLFRSSSHSFHDKKNHAYLYAHVKNATNIAHHDDCYDHVVFPVRHDAHSMFASSSSSHVHDRNRPRCHVHHVVSNAPRKASNGPTMIYQTYDASYVLICKNDKVVARNLGPKCKRDKTCIWVPKSYVTNLIGPKRVGYLNPKLKLRCRFMHPGAQVGLLTADAQTT